MKCVKGLLTKQKCMLILNIVIACLLFISICINHTVVRRLKQQNIELASIVIDVCENIRALLESQSEVLKITSEQERHNAYLAQCSQHTLIILRAYVISIQNTAIAHEKYEEAAKCKTLLQSIDKLINQ